MNSQKVLILGAGVSGLTTALKLLQSGHKVTIWSKEAPGEHPTTSFNAYAMWVPVKIDADPRVERWATESYDEFAKLSLDGTTGVAMRRIVSLKLAHEEPWYAGKLDIFRHATADEIPAGYAHGQVLDKAPAIDPTVYLPWLRQQVTDAGGVFEQHEVEQFSDCPSEFSVVVNCTGLGARGLTGDTDLKPQRVQIVKIKPNGLDHLVIDDEGPNARSCVVPHGDYVKVGAVFDTDSESLEVDESLTPGILERCGRTVPGFKIDAADVVSVTRALRPERSLTRVEIEKVSDSRSIVHNYGHDGMGYILSYGIATEIAGYLAVL